MTADALLLASAVPAAVAAAQMPRPQAQAATAAFPVAVLEVAVHPSQAAPQAQAEQEGRAS
jgi:hypothetical protein